MQGKYGKNTWKVKLAEIVGKLLVIACICGIVVAIIWLAKKVEFTIDFSSADFLTGVLELILAILLIGYIIIRNEWSDTGMIVAFGVIGAILSEVFDIVLGTHTKQLVGLFIIAAILAKVGLAAIPLFLELFCIAGAGITGIISSMSEETREMCAKIFNFNEDVLVLVITVIPLLLIVLKVRIHDRKYK